MSLVMEKAKPKPITASTFITHDGDVWVGEYKIPIDDFRTLVMYVMCNENISRPDDPRLELLEDLRSLTVIEDEHGKRFSGLRPLAQYFSSRR